MWLAYINWRLEEAVINQLWSMNDRDLKDIGLTRSEITSAVKGDFDVPARPLSNQAGVP